MYSGADRHRDVRHGVLELRCRKAILHGARPVTAQLLRFVWRLHAYVRLSTVGARRASKKYRGETLVTDVEHLAGLNRTGIGVNSTARPRRANLGRFGAYFDNLVEVRTVKLKRA
jgi:hypothetical protein